MDHYILLVDIAGRFSRSGTNLSVTTSGVAIAADRADYVRSLLPPSLPKWGQCTFAQAKEIGMIVARECLAMVATTLNLETPAWHKFWEDSEAHQFMLSRLERGKAGVLKPANIARIAALIEGANSASEHAASLSKAIEHADANSPLIIDQTLIFDDELGGESREFFMEFWSGARRQSRTQNLDITFQTCDARMATEQDEPLLLLPDYVAGLHHCWRLAGAERNTFPLTASEADACLGPLRNGKLKTRTAPFELNYHSILGSAIEATEIEMRRRYPND